MNKSRQIIWCASALVLAGVGAGPCLGSGAENKPFQIEANGIRLEFEFQGKLLRLKSMLPNDFRAEGFSPANDQKSGNVVLLQVTGDSQQEHHGPKFVGGNPGLRLEYVERREQPMPHGRQVVI